MKKNNIIVHIEMYKLLDNIHVVFILLTKRFVFIHMYFEKNKSFVFVFIFLAT